MYTTKIQSIRKILTLWTIPCFLFAIGVSMSHALDQELRDKDINNAIEFEFLTDERVPSHLIFVKTNEGLVTLTGSVHNLLAEDRAIEIAKSIKGVRSVVDRITVEPLPRSNTELRKDIEMALFDDPATDSYEIDVKVDDGSVTLTGKVDSWQEKQLAAEVAKGVKGIRELNNNIELVYKSKRPDAEIEAEIERRLASDIRVDAALIDVQVEEGKVALNGKAGSAAEISRAYNDAWVAGVTTVDTSNIKTEWWLRDEMQRKIEYTFKTDEEIEQAIKDAFLYDPRVSSFYPDVDVENGIVTLTGKVDNLKARKAAQENAENTIGVWRVKNLLKVRPDYKITDNEIIKSIRKAVLRDPILERHEISVVVYNGFVYLHGSVDSKFEKMQAEDVAARVKGVIDIENNITVDKSWTWRHDWEIRQDIESELIWSPFVDEEEITVTVDDGVATLIGTVDTWQEYHKATEEAYEGKARKVRNRLQVNFGPDDLLPKTNAKE